MRSCGDKYRHIKILYFFIMDILENEDIILEHCGTELMLADFLTKPLQGSVFRRMRDIIMGITPFPSEERVGDYRKKGGKPLTGGTSGRRTDAITYGANKNERSVCSKRPTYADIVSRVVKSKEEPRNSK